MIPRVIIGANAQFGPPDGWDTARDGHCHVINARREDNRISTAWEPTPAELAALNAGGSIVLTVVGLLPVFRLAVETPPKEPEDVATHSAGA